MKDYFFYADSMTVGYDGTPLIKEIKIELNRGEILTLIGPNGAGKSTILKSITRQLRLLGGTVWLDGQNLHRMGGKELAKKQAVLLTGRIHPELLTCQDVVATGRYPYTGALGLLGEEDRRKVREAMEMVHALDLRDRDFNAISDGQKQRIMLARAICQEPELIVLDEPTSFLDIKHKLEFLVILKKLVRENGVAVIMSLHELDLAQKISDQVICVKGDRIARYGTPEEIFTPEYIGELYDMETGAYNAAFGCAELPAPQGDPRVFVIAGGGSGIPVFRRLAREEVPFVAGILHKNDVDYEAARYLAARVVAQEAFEPIGEEAWEQALSWMKRCGQVICTLDRFGTFNQKNRELAVWAEKQGLLRKE